MDEVRRYLGVFLGIFSWLLVLVPFFPLGLISILSAVGFFIADPDIFLKN